jgi:hypothetical protein
VLRPVRLGLSLHLREPRVVVTELVQVRPGDLAGRDLVVDDVRRSVAATMLELDLETHSELLDVKS